MDTIKGKVNKIILGLTLVGIVLLMLPVSLYANHFRYGTMSWNLISDNGTHITILLKMQNGWTANHNSFREDGDYDTWVPGHVGSIIDDDITINWADGNTSDVDMKILSRDNTTGTASSDCAYNDNQSLARCKDSTISDMGEYSSSEWTLGVTHIYPDNGTTEYVVYWGSSARRPAENYPATNVQWRNETKVNIGGPYDGNSSPVSAVPPVVQVQDNKTFNYQLVGTDANGDTLNYRWGKLNEFFKTNGSGSTDNFSIPTGMTLSTSGLISWDVRDSALADGDGGETDDVWVAVIMVEDLDSSGNVKSYIPIDFFFKIASASNNPPVFTKFPTGTRTVSVGNTKTICK